MKIGVEHSIERVAIFVMHGGEPHGSSTEAKTLNAKNTLDIPAGLSLADADALIGAEMAAAL